jgi:hypothetical protein
MNSQFLTSLLLLNKIVHFLIKSNTFHISPWFEGLLLYTLIFNGFLFSFLFLSKNFLKQMSKKIEVKRAFFLCLKKKKRKNSSNFYFKNKREKNFVVFKVS